MKGNIKEARQRLGLTQSDVAERLGIPSRTYGAWERGERELNLEDAWNIAELFDCSLDYLSGRWDYKREAEHQRKRRINSLFDELNSEGQERLISHCVDLIGNPNYVKDIRGEKERVACAQDAGPQGSEADKRTA